MELRRAWGGGGTLKGREEAERLKTCSRVHLPTHLQDLGCTGAELASVPSCCHLDGGRHRYCPLQQEGGGPTLSQVISKPQGFSLLRAGMPYPCSQVLGLGFPLPVKRGGPPESPG